MTPPDTSMTMPPGEMPAADLGFARGLGDDVLLLKRELRRFIDAEVETRSRWIEENDAIPDDLMQMARDLGLFGAAEVRAPAGRLHLHQLELARDVGRAGAQRL